MAGASVLTSASITGRGPPVPLVPRQATHQRDGQMSSGPCSWAQYSGTEGDELTRQDVDGRDEPGHHGKEGAAEYALLVRGVDSPCMTPDHGHPQKRGIGLPNSAPGNLARRRVTVLKTVIHRVAVWAVNPGDPIRFKSSLATHAASLCNRRSLWWSGTGRRGSIWLSSRRRKALDFPAPGLRFLQEIDYDSRERAFDPICAAEFAS